MRGKAFAWAFAIMIVLSMLLSPVMLSSNVARAQSVTYQTYNTLAFLPTDAGLMWISSSNIGSYDTGYYYVLAVGTQLYIYNTTGTYPNLQLSSSYALNYTINPPSGSQEAILLVGPYNSTTLEIFTLATAGGLSFSQTFSTVTVTNTNPNAAFPNTYVYVYLLNLQTLSIAQVYSQYYSATSSGGTYSIYISTYSSMGGYVYWNMSALSPAPYYAVATVAVASYYTIQPSGIILSSPNGIGFGNFYSSGINWVSALYDPDSNYYVTLLEYGGQLNIQAFSGTSSISTTSVSVQSAVDTLAYTWYAHAFYATTYKGYSLYVYNEYGEFTLANGSGTWTAYQVFSFSNPSTVAPLSNAYVSSSGETFYYGPSGVNTAYLYMSVTQNGNSFTTSTYSAPTQYNPSLTWVILPAFITYQPVSQTLAVYGFVPPPQPPTLNNNNFNSTTTPPPNSTPTSPGATSYYINSSIGIMIIAIMAFLPAIIMAIYIGKTGFIVGLTLMIAILTAVGYLPLWVSVLAGLALLVMIWRPFGSGNEGD